MGRVALQSGCRPNRPSSVMMTCPGASSLPGHTWRCCNLYAHRSTIIHSHIDHSMQPMFGPIGQRSEGTYVFASPIEDGHVPMIALEDLGFFARYTFDHRAETSGKDLEIATDWVNWDYLIKTFTKVTGHKAEFLRQSPDEWFKNWARVDHPVANERPFGDGSTTWRQNFTGFWAQWRDDVITRDFEWLRKVNPAGYTLESWMRAKNYRGSKSEPLLKNAEDDKSVRLNWERVTQLLQASGKPDDAHRL